MQIPKISLITICTASNFGDAFSKSHLALHLHSTETDFSKLRAIISKVKQLSIHNGAALATKFEAVIAKPSALLIARFKWHFHGCQNPPRGIKAKKQTC